MKDAAITGARRLRPVHSHGRAAHRCRRGWRPVRAQRWGDVAILVVLAFAGRLGLSPGAGCAGSARPASGGADRGSAQGRPSSRRCCSASRRAALHPRHRALRARPRHPGADLRHARLGAQHRGRARGAARPRLRRLLRGRRLFLRAARHHLRLVLLDLPAARRDHGGLLGHPARLPGAAAARRLPRHRHARLRRDHPRRADQLGEPDRRAERHHRHPAPLLLRPALLDVGRARHLRRLLRDRALARAPRDLPLLPDPRARAADQLGQHPAAPPAARPRLGSDARGRDRLPLPRHQHPQHQADGLRDRRDVRRLRRRLLRHAPGLHQPGIFTFIESAIILAIVVLGGMGSQIGIAIAAW
jgi:hypothetical protein